MSGQTWLPQQAPNFSQAQAQTAFSCILLNSFQQTPVSNSVMASLRYRELTVPLLTYISFCHEEQTPAYHSCTPLQQRFMCVIVVCMPQLIVCTSISMAQFYLSNFEQRKPPSLQVPGALATTVSKNSIDTMLNEHVENDLQLHSSIRNPREHGLSEHVRLSTRQLSECGHLQLLYGKKDSP